MTAGSHGGSESKIVGVKSSHQKFIVTLHSSRLFTLRYLFNTSSRFISSLATIVQAARVGGVERRIGLRLAHCDQFLRLVGMCL